MRISDDRYSRDRLRLDLALRFIHHEARTHTIRAWTGLTDDRIRKLYRTYLHEADGAGGRASPRQIAAPGRVLHALAAHAARGRGVRERQQPVRPHHARSRSWSTRGRAARRPTSRAARCCAKRSRPTARSSANRRSRSSTRCSCSVRCWRATNCASRIAAIARGVLVTDRLTLRTPVCNECSSRADGRGDAVGGAADRVACGERRVARVR